MLMYLSVLVCMLTSAKEWIQWFSSEWVLEQITCRYEIYFLSRLSRRYQAKIFYWLQGWLFNYIFGIDITFVGFNNICCIWTSDKLQETCCRNFENYLIRNNNYIPWFENKWRILIIKSGTVTSPFHSTYIDK